MNNGIFVSHSTTDQVWCVELVRGLKAAGYDVWYDSTNLTAGVSWIQTIEREIIQRAFFILVDTPAALESRWVREEIELALRTDRRIIRVIHLPTPRTDFITNRQSLDACELTGDTAAERILPHLNSSSGLKAVHAHSSYEGAAYGASTRFLPFYVLLDCSESMRGAPIEAMREGMQMFYDQLMDDPEIRSKVKISVITFSDGAEQTELVPMKSFVAPILTAGGKRSLGGALTLLADSIELDVRRNWPTRRGDYCPIVFLITVGTATDSIEEAVARLKAFRYNFKPMIVALGAGPEADLAMLHQITDAVLSGSDMSGEKLREFVKFVSGSVQASSPLG